ncbi:unnamed protein product [Amoebophrya sp. A120]|nr:unnamed protein product [Amoebophrya sp. A120]|eukprot:GSA120T00022104001.1
MAVLNLSSVFALPAKLRSPHSSALALAPLFSSRPAGLLSCMTLPASSSGSGLVNVRYTNCTPAASAFSHQQTRFVRTKGVLKLHCSECRYVIKRRNVPILGVDCNANVRHKQLMTNPPKQSRPVPDWLEPWLEGHQLPRHPRWKMDFTSAYFTKAKYRNTHY